MEGIGNTPLIKLKHLTDFNCADIYVKLEGTNPTGSMKDRMALSMIELYSIVIYFRKLKT